jgi:hypothetical protein
MMMMMMMMMRRRRRRRWSDGKEIREWVYQDFGLLCAHCSL